MSPVTVPVAPEVLRWVQSRSGHDADYFVSRFHDWLRWLDGSLSPTVRDVEKLSEASHVPFGVFFLDSAPDVRLPIADFRTGRRAGTEEPSQDLLDVLHQSQRRQDWFRDYVLRQGGMALNFVGSVAGASDAEGIGARISARLHFAVASRNGLRTMEATRKYLVRAAEAAGVLVVATSMVGNNTRRMLDPEEFRGFSLSDDLAPLIFVNTADTLGGQLFTLLHELAHIWRGDSGLDNQRFASLSAESRERWCNDVAAGVLVPLQDLRNNYRGGTLPEELERLRKRYMASTLVVLLQLKKASILPADGFDDLYQAELERVMMVAGGSSHGGSSGGDFYANQPLRVGETLSKALMRDGFEGGTPMPEAIGLLGFKHVENFDTYAVRLGIR